MGTYQGTPTEVLQELARVNAWLRQTRRELAAVEAVLDRIRRVLDGLSADSTRAERDAALDQIGAVVLL